MPISKKCKFCAKVQPITLTLNDEVLGRNLGELIQNVSGIEVATLNVAPVLVCQECAVSLISTENWVQRVRAEMSKLRKLKKPASLNRSLAATPKKTPAKKDKQPEEIKETPTVKSTEDIILNGNGNKVDQLESDEETSNIVLPRNLTTLKQTPVAKHAVAANVEEDEDFDISDDVVALDAKYESIKTNEESKKKIKVANKLKSPKETPTKIDIQIEPQKSKTPKATPKKRKCSLNNEDVDVFFTHKKLPPPPQNETVENVHVKDPPEAEFSELMSFLSSVKETPSDKKHKKTKKKEKAAQIEEETHSPLSLKTYEIVETEVENDNTPAHEVEAEQHNISKSTKKQKKRKRHNTISQSTDGEQQQSSACVICGKTYASIDDLRAHVNKYHLSVEHKQCPNCNRTFRSQQKYESHVFNEKCKNALLQCQFENCVKRFSQKHSLNTHMQNNHGIAMA